MMTTKETTTSKGPSSCESTFNEIKAHEVQTLPKRLIAVAKLPVELLEDHYVSQVLCRTAKASCFQRAHSVHVQLELCGSSFSPSVTPRLHIRVYPRWIQLQITLQAPETQASSKRCVDQLESFASKKLKVCDPICRQVYGIVARALCRQRVQRSQDPSFHQVVCRVAGTFLLLTNL